MIAPWLARRVDQGELNPIDAHFSQLMLRLSASADPALGHLFADLCHSLANQHSCLDLAQRPDGKSLVPLLRTLAIVGNGDTETPLVLDGNLLFMHRYHRYEVRIAADLIARNQVIADPGSAYIEAILNQQDSLTGAQREATRLALTSRLSIIVGGPGTGKTFTAVSILRAILAQGGDHPPVIRVAAPTGKAAMRLAEAIGQTGIPDVVTVQTLHRLLGVRANGRDYRHGPGNPLPVDVVLVDEVSMVDLPMMHRLLMALPAEARLILLGDPDQLPSVETGNMLTDICRPEPDRHLLAEAIRRLETNYRFDAAKGIGRLSREVRSGAITSTADDDEISFHRPVDLVPEHLLQIFSAYTVALKGESHHDLQQSFEAARILCPVRDGEFGVVALNEAVETALSAAGLINTGERYYHGRPILITRNDYNLRLANGDVGLCLRRTADAEPIVVFRDTGNTEREYLASRLPPHETCFAMTVHKAQGSEFDHVALVLPDRSNPTAESVMTRELVYTAITRARRTVALYGAPDVLQRCLDHRTQRQSGLAQRFWKAPANKPGPAEQLDLFQG